MDTVTESRISGWRAWKCVLISLASNVVGLPPAFGFSTPTALGYIQLPGIIITFLVACCCTACFFLCPRWPWTPKLVALALAILPLFFTLQFVADYYLHTRYEK